jgi:hypothetical protein
MAVPKWPTMPQFLILGKTGSKPLTLVCDKEDPVKGPLFFKTQADGNAGCQSLFAGPVVSARLKPEYRESFSNHIFSGARV